LQEHFGAASVLGCKQRTLGEFKIASKSTFVASAFAAITGNAVSPTQPVQLAITVSNDMTDSTNAPNPITDINPTNLQTGLTSGNLQIDPSEVALAVLTPSAGRTITAGENAAEFAALVKTVSEFWQPQDPIERLLMADFIHAEWELRRLRRLVPAAFVAGRPFAVSKLAGFSEERFVDSAFPNGRYKEALADLAAKGHTCDVLDGQTLLMHTAAFESFDRRAAVLEVRRDNAWDKVERRRTAIKTISSPALSETDR
jgi:hypothetical protein